MPRPPDDRTNDQHDADGDTTEAPTPAPFLFVVFNCVNQRHFPMRIALRDVAQVEVTRGQPGHVQRLDNGRRLVVEVADGWMSRPHAVLHAENRQIFVRDEGSKNGTRIDGEPLRGAAPCKGRFLEMGRTFLLVEEMPVPSGIGDETVALPAGPPTGVTSLNPALAAQFARLRSVAPSRLPVLVLGETGTGKELAARAVHELSGRAARQLISVNCAAIPETLFESEMFGTVPGAYTGAKDRAGWIERSSGGTLFLDEIGDLPPLLQAKLLRVVEYGEVQRLGASRPTPVDLRLVSATRRSLAELVEAGTFRDDLYNRLRDHELLLPPLRERREDFGLLVDAILATLPVETGQPVQFTLRATRFLLDCSWPGNIRQLQRALRRALLLAQADTARKAPFVEVRRRHLAEDLQDPPDKEDLKATFEWDELTREQLELMLRAHDGNVAAVARECGVTRGAIWKKCKQWRIEPDEFRRGGV